jgi:hypothetical protein
MADTTKRRRGGNGTRAGGLKAYATLVSIHGTTADGKSAFHSRIGAEGGRNGRTGGFYGTAGKERAKVAGVLGGTISRRGSDKLSDPERKQAVKRALRDLTDAELLSREQVRKLSQRYGVRRSW